MNDLLLLAMLLEGPKYGYQLKREAGWMSGQESLHNNLVYPMLRRFLNEGWVSKKSVPGQRGQTRQQYALSGEGRRYLIGRLHEFSDSDAASEGAFNLRVGLFEALKPESREAILSRRESYLEHREEKLATLAEEMDLGKFGDEVVKHLRQQLEIDREWVRHLRRIAKKTDRGK